MDVYSLPSLPLERVNEAPAVPGVYFVLTGGEVQYVGSTTVSLRQRLSGHRKLAKCTERDTRVAWLLPSNVNEIRGIELQMIRRFRPSLNHRGLKRKTGLEMVQGAVPPQVASLLRKMAASEGRTLSAIVRRIVEQSPAVRAELRQNGKGA